MGATHRRLPGLKLAGVRRAAASLRQTAPDRAFSADVASVGNEEIRERSRALLENWIAERGRTKAEEALSFAKANGRGVTGLRRVLQALETGEVQTLFLGDQYSAHAVECVHCGHLDAHLVPACVACGRRTRN